MDLTAENVYATFLDSLALETDRGPPTRVRGLTNEYSFDAERLRAHGGVVRGFLGRLSTRFYVDRGGGHTVLAMGTRRDGLEWGDSYDVERLLVLGLGLGLAHFCLKRRTWDVFPRAMPYVRLDSGLFKLWASFHKMASGETVQLSFDPDHHLPPPAVREEAWYRPGSFLISELSSNSRRHVAESFYISVVVDGFFDDALPSWILDPETTLEVY